MKHVMIDLETLATVPGAAVISVGALVFDPMDRWFKGPHFYMNVDVKSCEEIGLVIDPRTHAWWQHPDRADAWAQMQTDQMPIAGVVKAFNMWFRKHAGSETPVWAHGAAFDFPIWEMATKFCGESVPWNFRYVRDTRTIFDFVGIDFSVVPKEATYHNALDDCRNQASSVCSAYAILERMRETEHRMSGLDK
jgi:hypothetical protein